jgi:hypothetical protein
MVRQRWPQWLDWELELSSHIFKRMTDRGFSELDLRTMLEHPGDYKKDTVEGRYIIFASHRRRKWEIIVEPDLHTKRLVIITAYPCWGH